MSWLWPTSRREETTALVRAGRVLHWASLGPAVLLVIVGIIVSYPESDRVALMGIFLVGSLATLLIGRSIRYVLSNE
jgi:hypothetical protein